MKSKLITFACETVDVAQLVRAPVCGTGGRGFDPPHSPGKRPLGHERSLFYNQLISYYIIQFTGMKICLEIMDRSEIFIL